jgi:Asp-tRNA(Asn)/Glu-tRNA(Gln) amidotransferase A subunit family amidase
MAPDDRRTFLLRAAAVAAAGTALARPSSAAVGNVLEDEVTAATLAEAEKLAGIGFSDAERAQILRTIGELRAQLAARRRSGVAIANSLPPAEAFRADLPESPAIPVTADGDPTDVPQFRLRPGRPTDEDLCWANIPMLGAMLRAKLVSSERLTQLALDRFDRMNPTLRCAITVMREQALERARSMDAELEAGKARGPLHGIPWAAKDILDTKGVRTTWGAEPWQDRVPTSDAWVVSALERAGAVLVAKTAVGALAYGDIWFGGTCRNPWNPEEGSSGSSAGSACAVAAGIVPFALGSETLGSIVSPCARCGASGLRPTFGRVPRTGCMSLVWSMDKIGPIARSAADCGLVLSQLTGADAADPASEARPLRWSMAQGVEGLRIGFAPAWFEGPGKELRPVLDALREAGASLVEIAEPGIDPTPLLVPLFAEAAAAFEDLTRDGLDDRLSWQADEAWPNTFRQAWFIPAIELVQSSRYRREAMRRMNAYFGAVDAVVCPPFAGGLLTLTNSTGQPCAVARAGLSAAGKPLTATVMSRVFDEGTALRVAQAIERRLVLPAHRPPFATEAAR